MGNIIDISVDNHRQQIRLNNDDNRIIEIDLADPNILTRLHDGVREMEKLLTHRDELRAEISSTETDTDTGREQFLATVNEFSSMEAKMRIIINDIFDYDVCTPFLGRASIFSVKDGTFMYEVIIDTLLNLYEQSIQAESQKIKERFSKHTDKYLKK